LHLRVNGAGRKFLTLCPPIEGCHHGSQHGMAVCEFVDGFWRGGKMTSQHLNEWPNQGSINPGPIPFHFIS
jgi:hypothetical protein